MGMLGLLVQVVAMHMEIRILHALVGVTDINQMQETDELVGIGCCTGPKSSPCQTASDGIPDKHLCQDANTDAISRQSCTEQSEHNYFQTGFDYFSVAVIQFRILPPWITLEAGLDFSFFHTNVGLISALANPFDLHSILLKSHLGVTVKPVAVLGSLAARCASGTQHCERL
jgi:hypothetical protein